VRLLFIGDIVGRPGIQLVENTIPGYRREQSIDLVIANAENADGGSGLTPAIYRKLIRSGIDCITLGDHIYKKKEIVEILESNEYREAGKLSAAGSRSNLGGSQDRDGYSSRRRQPDGPGLHEACRLPVYCG
jgi:hypothetical protein